MNKSYYSNCTFIIIVITICYTICGSKAQIIKPDKALSTQYNINSSSTIEQLQFGFLFSNTTADLYTLQHDIARGKLVRYLESLNYSVVTEVYVYVTDEETLQIMHDWSNRNFTCIFSTSGSFTSLTTKFMKEENKTKIATWGSVKPDWRSESFDNEAWKATFLAGMACRLASKTSNIAWVGFSVTRSIVRNILAFEAGASIIDNDTTVFVSFTNNLFNPILESRTGQYLIDNFKTDCGLGTINGINSYQANDLTAIGYNGDVRYTSDYINNGTNIWFSVLNNWESVYSGVANRILAGTFGNAKKNVCKLGDCFDISNFSPKMPIEYVNIILKYRKMIVDGSFDVFCGDRARKAGLNVTGNACAKVSAVQALGTLPNYINTGKNVTLADVLEYFYVKNNDPLGITLTVFTIISLIASVLILILVIVYRDNYVIRQASPIFCLIVIGGCIIGQASVFSWVGEPSQTSCSSRIWVGGIAFAIVYGALFVKNWRIWRIFGNTSMEVFAITNNMLLGGLAVILAGEIIILAIWSGIDPFLPQDQSSQLLSAWQYNRRCSSSSKSIWQIPVFITYNIAIIIAGVFVSYKTRTIGSAKTGHTARSSGDVITKNSTNNTNQVSLSGSKKRWYRESTEIGYSIFYTVLFGFICIVLMTGTPYTVGGEVGFIGFSIIIIFDVVLGFVFGLKFHRILWDKEGLNPDVKNINTNNNNNNNSSNNNSSGDVSNRSPRNVTTSNLKSTTTTTTSSETPRNSQKSKPTKIESSSSDTESDEKEDIKPKRKQKKKTVDVSTETDPSKANTRSNRKNHKSDKHSKSLDKV